MLICRFQIYQKFKNHTGWKPQIKFEKTMLDLLDYWRKKLTPKELL